MLFWLSVIGLSPEESLSVIRFLIMILWKPPKQYLQEQNTCPIDKNFLWKQLTHKILLLVRYSVYNVFIRIFHKVHVLDTRLKDWFIQSAQTHSFNSKAPLPCVSEIMPGVISHTGYFTIFKMCFIKIFITCFEGI